MTVFTAPDASPATDVPSAMIDPRSASAVVAKSERSVRALGKCMVGLVLNLWNVIFVNDE